jgi:hypothetical protein
VSTHAKLSPSGAHRWMACPGSVTLEAPFPDTSSEFAAEGTLAHEIAAKCLDNGVDPAALIGQRFPVDGFEFTVDQSMVDHVKDYMSLVREFAEGGQLLVEKRVGIGHLTGEEGAGGTSDVIIIKGTEIIVIDLKYGMGVRVDANENPQLMLYALGALSEYDILGDFDTVTMVIHQPRLNHVSEYSIPVQELLQFGYVVQVKAKDVSAAITYQDQLDTWNDDYLNPGEKQCKFCKAKAVCPALRADMAEVVGGASSLSEFADLVPQEITSETSDNYLPIAMSKVEMVEQWCKAIRAETERRLLAGQPVTGYKLVAGRAGNRDWKDATAVEEMMKKTFRMRDDQVYDFKLISPTKAEKALKENPKRWASLQEQIVRSEGKPSVAPATDKRPAMDVKPVMDDFRDLTAN